MIKGFNVGALKTVKIVTFVASANAQKPSISGRLLSLLRGSKWGVNETLEITKKQEALNNNISAIMHNFRRLHDPEKNYLQLIWDN